MPVVICLLRGVNVTGNNLIKMEALRELCGSIGFRDAKTLLQSGNVVFRTSAKNIAPVAKRIEQAIEDNFGFRPLVILRQASDLEGVLARNPFAKRKDVEPGKLLVVFLAEPVSAEAQEEIRRIKTVGEEVHVIGREVFIFFPNGQGQSKIFAGIERALKKAGTGRNLNTVTKLLALAADLEGKTKPRG